MPGAIRHPFTAMTYEAAGTDRVRVNDGKRFGLFDRSGNWIEGEIKSADPCFCRFLASGILMEERRREWGRAYK